MNITIHNLDKATPMQVFTYIKSHLLTQGVKSESTVKGKSGCRYRGPKGTKCAVGCIIPDSDYKRSMEGASWSDVVQRSEGELTEEHMDLLDQLQNIHDTFDPPEWEEELNDLESSIKKGVYN